MLLFASLSVNKQRPVRWPRTLHKTEEYFATCWQQATVEAQARRVGRKGDRGIPRELKSVSHDLLCDISVQLLEKGRGNPLRVNGKVVSMEQLLLVEVRHVSKGSVEPVFGLL